MEINWIKKENSFNKISVEADKIVETLKFLKNNPEYDFDRLNTIIAVDLGSELEKIELIYDLHSSKTDLRWRISVLIDRNSSNIPSVVDVYKSAYFDECEIYDLFGVVFDKNPNLKRLLMPEGWVGNPLRKDYVQDDARLAWNN